MTSLLELLHQVEGHGSQQVWATYQHAPRAVEFVARWKRLPASTLELPSVVVDL